ncbi:MAG: LysR family transcriptional regulator [Trinickia sp.]
MARRATTAQLNWNLLRAFSETAQHRSFAEAARAAGVQRPTISEKMARLEAELGGRLMERRAGNDGFRLTHHGKRLRRLLSHFEGLLAGLEMEMSGQSPRDEATDILREVEDALSALERARKALRKGQ